MALALAGCGARIVVNGRNAAGIESTRAAIVAAGGGATAMAFDTTDAAGADAAIDRIERDLGHLDILVNNAGYGDGKTAAEATNAEWDEIIEVDLNACFRLARRAHVGMARRGWGRVINISSVHPQDTTLPIAREIVEAYVTDDVKLPWYIDLLNSNLDNHDLTKGQKANT